MSISPDLAFVLTLLLRMAVTAAFVVTASIITERSGPLIGALVATLPVFTGPVYVFLALDHDNAFIAASALAALPINAVIMAFGMIYAMMAQRHSAVASFGTAILAWLALVLLAHSMNWSLGGALAVNALVCAFCLPLAQRYRKVVMPPIRRRWYDIPLRALLVALMVATVVALSSRVGPAITGILAVFPVVSSSLMLILHPRIGGKPTAAVIANSGWGLMGFGLAIAVLHVAVLRFGSAIGLSLALATCVVWNLALWLNGRRRGLVR
jgi:hypothetical protein